MNPKLLIQAALSSRKNATLLAGIALGLLLASEYPGLVDQVRAWIKEIGIGGVVAYGLSVWMSAEKKQEQKTQVVAALYSPPPVSPSDEKAALKALE